MDNTLLGHLSRMNYICSLVPTLGVTLEIILNKFSNSNIIGEYTDIELVLEEIDGRVEKVVDFYQRNCQKRQGDSEVTNTHIHRGLNILIPYKIKRCMCP